jgi:catechol 2,3-dioxygenase-like lactoylglutathione lyase family enzyme
MTTPIFDAIRCVAVPVSDLDRSKALFEQLGWNTSFDAELQPGFRWIELATGPDGAALALVHAGDQLPAGIDTGIRLLTSDARAAHDAVRAAGLVAGDLLDWPTAPLMFSFTDLDGNRFYVSEDDTTA